jgi:predicted dehydrogenase
MIKIGQIGVGAWGKNLLRNFATLTDCQVIACSDLDSGILERVEHTYPQIKVSSGPSELIENPEIQAVVIATPAPTHHELTKQALQAGKDVLVEKPLSLSIKDAEDLVDIAERTGRVLMVGHLMEYHPALGQLKQCIDEGRLGEVYYVYSTRVNLGKIRKDENALWSFAPHDISVVLYLLGEEPHRVTAVGQYYLQQKVEDVVFLTLHFKGRTMAHIHVSWLDPHKIRKLTVVGSKKMAVFDDTQAAEMIRLYDKGVDQVFDYETYGEALSLRMGDVLIPRVKMSEPLRIECQHFLDCIAKRIPPRSDGQDGLRVVRVLEAAQQSMQQGGAPVEIS